MFVTQPCATHAKMLCYHISAWRAPTVRVTKCKPPKADDMLHPVAQSLSHVLELRKVDSSNPPPFFPVIFSCNFYCQSPWMRHENTRANTRPARQVRTACARAAPQPPSPDVHTRTHKRPRTTSTPGPFVSLVCRLAWRGARTKSSSRGVRLLYPKTRHAKHPCAGSTVGRNV